MALDPAPLRYRTYLWFPVFTVGSILLVSLAFATETGPKNLVLLHILLLSGLYVSAFLGYNGLLGDASSLVEADADWQPSWRRYVTASVVVASVVAVLALFPPVPVSKTYAFGAVGIVGVGVVSLALASGPVCLAYLYNRRRRIGLNYLK
ncbi:hypothetical protein [Haloferax sp. DFSO52]|uniref:hypothetical protein n=1 Tax=Haloferax sp. DFSO52 TaxID=3388505 RepID=UPI003A83B4B3